MTLFFNPDSEFAAGDGALAQKKNADQMKRIIASLDYVEAQLVQDYDVIGDEALGEHEYAIRCLCPDNRPKIIGLYDTGLNRRIFILNQEELRGEVRTAFINLCLIAINGGLDE